MNDNLNQDEFVLEENETQNDEPELDQQDNEKQNDQPELDQQDNNLDYNDEESFDETDDSSSEESLSESVDVETENLTETLEDEVPSVDGITEEPLSKKEIKRRKKEEEKRLKEENKKKLLEEKEKKRQEKLKEIEERKKKRNQKNKKEEPEIESDEPSELDNLNEEDLNEEDLNDVDDKNSKRKKSKTKGKNKKEPQEKPVKQKKPTTLGDKKVPYEKEEDINPRIKLYNSIARTAYNMSSEKISLNGLSMDEGFRIFRLVTLDYPELFWVQSCIIYNETELEVIYRCLKSNGKIDKAQINKKMAELKKAALPFIRGITKKTDPYKAILTIYRRLILTLDYDGIGLAKDSITIEDTSTDDVLRSLHSALVTHKVVCAGYAVAFQYLLNLIGVTSAYVSSEAVNGVGHAFNVVRIKNKCYYVDATWGDMSNTSDKNGNYKDVIQYDYCCVPYKELILTDQSSLHCHTPNRQLYPNLKQFDNTDYEYFRYHKAYFTRRDDKALLDLFIKSVVEYDEKEMGRFSITFRVSSKELFKSFYDYITSTDVISRMVEETKKRVKGSKDEKKLKYIKQFKYYFYNENARTFLLLFEQEENTKKRDANKKK